MVLILRGPARPGPTHPALRTHTKEIDVSRADSEAPSFSFFSRWMESFVLWKMLPITFFRPADWLWLSLSYSTWLGFSGRRQRRASDATTAPQRRTRFHPFHVARAFHPANANDGKGLQRSAGFAFLCLSSLPSPRGHVKLD